MVSTSCWAGFHRTALKDLLHLATFRHKRRKQANRGAWRGTVLTCAAAVNRSKRSKHVICRALPRLRRKHDITAARQKVAVKSVRRPDFGIRILDPGSLRRKIVGNRFGEHSGPNTIFIPACCSANGHIQFSEAGLTQILPAPVTTFALVGLNRCQNF